MEPPHIRDETPRGGVVPAGTEGRNFEAMDRVVAGSA